MRLLGCYSKSISSQLSLANICTQRQKIGFLLWYHYFDFRKENKTGKSALEKVH
jgi:hypothetical protein